MGDSSQLSIQAALAVLGVSPYQLTSLGESVSEANISHSFNRNLRSSCLIEASGSEGHN